MSHVIRTAQDDDAPGIAKVHVKTWQTAYKDQLPAEYLQTLSIEKRTAFWEKTIKENDPEKNLYVATKGDAIVGFCGAGPARDIDSPPDLGELYAIYVDAAVQGQGIGLALMNTGLEFLRQNNFSRAILWVLETNTKTIDFYEKHGWKADGAKKEDTSKGVVLKEIRYNTALK